MKKKRQIPASEPAAHGLEGAAAHAACGRYGRQKCRERGYYYLHRNLNNPFLHTLYFIFLMELQVILFPLLSSCVPSVASQQSWSGRG